MPSIQDLSIALHKLSLATANARAMEGYTTEELQQLAFELNRTTQTLSRIESELSRRNGVGAGWIPDC
jgi:hypothetical protein